MTTMDDERLRRLLAGLRHGDVWITANRCQGDSRAVDAFVELIGIAPALAAEVLRLRERVARANSDAAGYLADHAAALLDLAAATARAEKAEAERDALRAAVRDFLDAPASCYGVALQGVVDALDRVAPCGIAAAARAHLAADDALSLARRTDAADVPTAEARALAARECLAGLVGYAGEVGR